MLRGVGFHREEQALLRDEGALRQLSAHRGMKPE
jgi:hypothetical protein